MAPPEPTPGSDTDTAPETDGRRRRGRHRRRALLDATLRVVARDGVGGVTQRAVAAEAGVAPSAVFYYFATVDDLVAAVLVDVNDRYLDALAAVPDGPGAAAEFAAVVAGTARTDRAQLVAEVELWVLAARRPALRPELERWDAGVRAAARRLTADPVAVEALVDVVNGHCLRALTGGPDADLLAIVRRVVG
ncbi:MAG: TetR family transcriptional regulator [Pseudonocardiales bacterium]|nr:TetR family transcriptional regulator [Pseudonocardiales bacterium]